MFCFFHSSCSDPYHFALSLVIAFCCILLASFLAFVVWFIVDCCIHTSDCNQLSLDNYSSIIDLRNRVRSLEDKYSELT